MKRVIVVGGGFAGAYIARKLEKSFDVTLIDTKNYFEFTPSVLRTLVEPEHIRYIQRDHHRYLQQTRVVQDHVREVREHDLKTSHQTFPFDYLVICSGSRYNSPIKEEDLVVASRAEELRRFAHKLHKAQNVLIIGGGIVGVELAAEIITTYPNKKITLVHAHQRVMERMPPAVSSYAENFLTMRGVQIIYNTRVEINKKSQSEQSSGVFFNLAWDQYRSSQVTSVREFPTETTAGYDTQARNQRKTYHLSRGEKITPDLAFLCTGITPNSEFMEKNFLSLLTEKKYVNVTKTLQVEGKKHMFAAGDVTSIQEEKTAQNAEKQAQVVVENILRQERGETAIEYHSRPRVMVISLGRWNGILTYKNVVLTGILPGIMKTLIEWKTMWRYR